jgi:hypothetical protein
MAKCTRRNKRRIVYREPSGRFVEVEVCCQHLDFLTHSTDDDPSLPYVALAPQQAADFARWLLERAIELGAK